MSNEIAKLPVVQRQAVIAPVPIYDSARFDHMGRIAAAMARGSLIPNHLKGKSFDETASNCLLVVNQSMNWGMDPFAVAACTSVVHGRLMFEGKLVAAVIAAKLGLELDYEWTGEEGQDDYGIIIRDPERPDRYVDGTVGKWRTGNELWKKEPRKMLKYRGDREWARMWAPALMLGVYSEDEMEGLADDVRARRAQQVEGSGIAARLGGQGNPGFSPDHAEKALGQGAEKASIGPNKGGGDEKVERADNISPLMNGAGAPLTGSDNQNEIQNSDAPSPASEQSSAPSDDGAVSSVGAEPLSHSSPRPAPSASDDDGAARSREDVEPPHSFAEYAKKLGLATTEKSVKGFDQQYRSANAWTTDEAHEKKLRSILLIHLQRVRGEIDDAKCAAMLKKALM